MGLLSRGPLVYSPSREASCILTCPVGGGDQQGLLHIPLKELALPLSVWVVGAQEVFNTGQFLKPEGPLSSGLGTQHPALFSCITSYHSSHLSKCIMIIYEFCQTLQALHHLIEVPLSHISKPSESQSYTYTTCKTADAQAHCAVRNFSQQALVCIAVPMHAQTTCTCQEAGPGAASAENVALALYKAAPWMLRPCAASPPPPACACLPRKCPLPCALLHTLCGGAQGCVAHSLEHFVNAQTAQRSAVWRVRRQTQSCTARTYRL